MTAAPDAIAISGSGPTSLSGRRFQAAVGAVGVALVWATAAIHLRLYAIGYDSIPTIGWLFLVQGVAGSVLGAVILLFRRLLAYVAGAGFMVASIGGFLTSIWFGLFGFRDSFAAPYAGMAVATEAAGAVVLLTAAGLWIRRRPGRLGLGR